MDPIAALILGLFVFLASHSIRIFADGWRTAMVGRLGLLGWKALIAVVSLAGFALLVWGYGASRAAPTVLWLPPLWTRHLAALLTLPALILLVAAYVPGNRFKTLVGHPMVAGTKVWALAHLLANGNLADVLLFGSFLTWAVLSFSASRRRDRSEGRRYPAGPGWRTAVTAVVGVAAWALFATVLHGPLIGVRPFG